MTKIIIRPHHLLDIIRDYGNGIDRSFHPYGASLKQVTDIILSDIDQNIRLTAKTDSICISCSKLEDDLCTALIGDSLLMRDYNDKLDRDLFELMNLVPDSELTVRRFLKIAKNRLPSILAKFTSPSNNSERREAGTIIALDKLKI